MSNVARRTYKTPRTPNLCPIADQIHAGWTDYRNGLGFVKDYDLWPQVRQINYEIGRRLAAVVASGGNVPAWARNRLCPPMSQGLRQDLHPAWEAEIKYDNDTGAIAT